MKKNSNRLIRINEEIKHELSAVIREGLKDPRVDTLVSIVHVDTTPDLKYCKVFSVPWVMMPSIRKPSRD